MKKISILFGILLIFTQFFCYADSIKSSKKQVYIVHGFGANSDKHWFKWLKTELEKDKNISVKLLNMPNSKNPNLQEWLNTLAKEASKIDENTYFVGHSLGCISILRYLDSKNLKSKVGGVFLVSGFYESLEILPQLDSFTKPPLDFARLDSKINSKFVFSARDDEIVPTTLSQNLAVKLKAIFIQIPTGKHFMDREGVKEMPLLRDILRATFE